MKRRKKQTKLTRRTVSHKPVDESLPFVEHLEELRTRVIHVAASVLFFGTAAYFVQQHIVNLLIRPAHGQHFIYTSPGGGISFLFGVCTDVGIIFSLPVLVYEVLGFLKPLLNHQARRFIGRCMIVSVGLGLLGVAFGYYMGLPLALHFLGHQFSTKQITPLLTISEYMSFVTIYLFGSAMLFQIPLVLIMINRIKPLNPKKLLKYERWVIVIAFIVSALMAPTVNVIDQLVIAGPVIIAYQVGIGIIWWNARKQKRRHPRYYDATLVERDRQNQVDRIRQAEEARTRLLARQEAVSAGRHTSIA